MIQRQQASFIQQSASHFPVIGILVLRQSGKTTLAKMLFNAYVYVNLEDPDMRAAALADPRTVLLTNSAGKGLIIDEFQHAPLFPKDSIKYFQNLKRIRMLTIFIIDITRLKNLQIGLMRNNLYKRILYGAKF